MRKKVKENQSKPQYLSPKALCEELMQAIIDLKKSSSKKSNVNHYNYKFISNNYNYIRINRVVPEK
jgi:hypothetical protein